MPCCSQQGYNPFLPFGGFGPAQGMPPQVAQAIMQQQAAAAMFGAGQPGMPGFGTGPPPDMDPATAMRSIQFAQAMAANAAMMGFQVRSSPAQFVLNPACCWHFSAVALALSQLPEVSRATAAELRLSWLAELVSRFACHACHAVHTLWQRHCFTHPHDEHIQHLISIYACRMAVACPSMAELLFRARRARCHLDRRDSPGHPAQATCLQWAALPMGPWTLKASSRVATPELTHHLQIASTGWTAWSSAPLMSRCGVSRTAGNWAQVIVAMCILLAKPLHVRESKGNGCKRHSSSVKACMTSLGRKRTKVVLKCARIVRTMLHVHCLYNMLQALLSTSCSSLSVCSTPSYVR